MANINWDVLGTVSGSFVTHVSDNAVINADPSKGIPERVEVPFTKPVFMAVTAEDAQAIYNALGQDVFNGLLNYSSDLRRRGNATQAERAKLTADPLKKELKSLAALSFSEAQQDAYVAARRNGLDAKAALAEILTL
jgi:hypothetical protein